MCKMIYCEEKEIIMKMFRLTDKEEETLRNKCIEINKILINTNREPLKDSELMHEILNDVLERIEAGKEKRITII